jgi:hypothetical protein
MIAPDLPCFETLSRVQLRISMSRDGQHAVKTWLIGAGLSPNAGLTDAFLQSLVA